MPIDNRLSQQLIQGVFYNDVEEVKRLCAMPQVDVNVMTKKGKPVLMCAIDSKDVNVVKALLSSNKIDVNKTSKFGFSPLMLACRIGAVEIVDLLLNRPDINYLYQSDDGKTATDVATLSGYEEIEFKLVEKRYLHLQAQDRKRKKAYFYIKMKQKPYCVQKSLPQFATIIDEKDAKCHN